MTVPIERTNAVVQTEEFLAKLLDPKLTPKIPKSIRKEAASLLKHYPSKFDMEIISEREDSLTQVRKVFGRGFE